MRPPIWTRRSRHFGTLPVGGTDRVACLSGLGALFPIRHEDSADEADLDAAGRAALAALPAGRPERSLALSGLCAALRAKFDHTTGCRTSTRRSTSRCRR